MPIYEYACTRCEHAFDELQKISEAALVHCPKCGEASLRKLLSAPKFRLAGKGWYETDFKTGTKRNLAGESDKSDSKADDKPAKTADEKPAKKADGKSEDKPARKIEPKQPSDSKANTT
ncbi:MAG: zinc ribbon domain-containing protein [Gammaproteobacteria bacterium]|nr:zinc ribbon domain-containing protein [Gammaproteobacteria bacterium]MBT8109121.1 zinc ribbon domain-containing protein [Gammaproteobacteria bacterium]NNL43824.1 zinc ribbon domain-containing protein [Woeseiaceae bacterium]